MGILLFLGGSGLFVLGFACGGLCDFKWEAYYNYKLKRDELAMKYRIEEGAKK